MKESWAMRKMQRHEYQSRLGIEKYDMSESEREGEGDCESKV